MFKLFRNTLYIRIEPENIALLHVESGSQFADIPMLAIETRKGKSTIIATGRDALMLSGRDNITISNGFRHPRTLLADFAIAEQTLKHFVRKTLPKSLFVTSPVMIIQPLALLEGGLTQIEIRAFAELGALAGARQVYLWVGPELTRDELSKLNFARAGGQLLFP
ncbi:rod shape-determining protein [Methylomonas sp. LL1]|uniref:rod shape-determining protein n=1 Tax=Methylomonas sp. LL1 TaxID=2785785 RepID=UPI0018C37591|nr:rod shape-determining protein [Methylomonas sp. LL1]QPK64956.1 rod shape-determining protein [Methylomonas sp. LL1]